MSASGRSAGPNGCGSPSAILMISTAGTESMNAHCGSFAYSSGVRATQPGRPASVKASSRSKAFHLMTAYWTDSESPAQPSSDVIPTKLAE